MIGLAIAARYEVAFQGVPGAYSEDASAAALGRDRPDPTAFLACPTLDRVFDAVRSGIAPLGVVPVENTLAGSVQLAYDLLRERDLVIVGEQVQRISHALIGVAGARLGDVERVMSHTVALAQCRRFFERHPHITPVAAYDTAGAAAEVIRAGRPTDAAIASRRSADIYRGSILAEGLEDEPENYTRFVVVTTHDGASSADPRSGVDYKTSVVLTLVNRPGALVDVLSHFACREVDLAMIESRPQPGRPFEYAFYLDLIGHANDGPVRTALAAARVHAESLDVLGSYPRAIVDGVTEKP